MFSRISVSSDDYHNDNDYVSQDETNQNDTDLHMVLKDKFNATIN
jgi:hypothetical protein